MVKQIEAACRNCGYTCWSSNLKRESGVGACPGCGNHSFNFRVLRDGEEVHNTKEEEVTCPHCGWKGKPREFLEGREGNG